MRELEQSNREMMAAKEAALAACAAKSEFLAKMSHELRTPMNGVLGMAELMLGTALTTDQGRQLQTIQRSAQSLLKILNDLLDFSKIEAGKLLLEERDFELETLVEETVSMLSEQARAKGLRLTWSVSDDVAVRGDPGRIRQVLTNLLANAVKFTREGGVDVSVSITKEPGGRVAFFEVRDTGIGLDATQVERIFESFAQADGSTTRRYGGTGLGLAIGRDLVEMMGGQIGVESRTGEGSMFWFTVKLGEGSIGKRVLGDCGASGIHVRPLLMRVLVAEDNMINQEVARGMLERLGCEVDVVGDGVEALQAIATDQFDAVLMDCQMPRMDGYAATRAIRAGEVRGPDAPCLPVIALTANAMRGDREKCLEAGMVDFLSKPFTLREIFEVLSRWRGPAPVRATQRPLTKPTPPA